YKNILSTKFLITDSANYYSLTYYCDSVYFIPICVPEIVLNLKYFTEEINGKIYQIYNTFDSNENIEIGIIGNINNYDCIEIKGSKIDDNLKMEIIQALRSIVITPHNT
ncbi:MAG: hypothetical protein ABIJ16_13805, partial [Bacteroidota bacterium]